MFDVWTVDVPMERWPIANWLLIAFICLVSILAWGMQEDSDSERKAAQIIYEIGKLADKPDPKKFERLHELTERLKKLEIATQVPGTLQPRNFHWYQPLTSVLVHAHLGHLIGNMFFLFIFGNAINSKLGHFWFITLFLLIGILESLVWLLIGRGQPTLGASAAIMGIMGLFLVFYPRNDIKMVYFFYFIPIHAYYISAFWIILVYIGFDLVGAIWFFQSATAFLSHLVGAALGITAGIVSLKQEWIEPVYEEENILQTMGFQKKLKRYADVL